MAKEVKTKEVRDERWVEYKDAPPIWDREPDEWGEEREGGGSDLEGQRSRVEAGERKMSSVASTPFFMELLPPLDTNISTLHMETDTHSIFNTAVNAHTLYVFA